jgi:hypothetical protein
VTLCRHSDAIQCPGRHSTPSSTACEAIAHTVEYLDPRTRKLVGWSPPAASAQLRTYRRPGSSPVDPCCRRVWRSTWRSAVGVLASVTDPANSAWGAPPARPVTPQAFDVGRPIGCSGPLVWGACCCGCMACRRPDVPVPGSRSAERGSGRGVSRALRTPRVVVVMPAYNAARTLVRTDRDIPGRGRPRRPGRRPVPGRQPPRHLPALPFVLRTAPSNLTPPERM